MIKLPSIDGIEKLPSSAEMRAFDKTTIDAGTPSSLLMERAGSAVALRLKALFHDRKRPVVFFCGPGNNGGDGFVAAVKMAAAGYSSVRVVLVESERYSEDLSRERERYIAKGLPLTIFSSQAGNGKAGPGHIGGLLAEGAVVVDAMLGTGQTEAPRGEIKALLECLNPFLYERPSLARVSIDVPTGLDADSGAVYEPHFEADCTVAIERMKRGCVQYPGRGICGEIFVESIGIDCTGDCEASLLTERNIPQLRERRQDSHKGDFGRVLVTGGSADMPGAPLLSAYSALRCGSGLVVVAQLEKASSAAMPPELILKRVSGTASMFEPQHLAQLEAEIENCDVFIVGPGLGLSTKTRDFTWALLSKIGRSGRPMVIDADALTHLAEAMEKIQDIDLSSAVLTPHPGEASRLLHISTEEVQADRYASARELFIRTGAAAVVLKGAYSIVYAEPGAFVNPAGNPYMATAGSGDVLTGLIAGLMAQGLTPPGAAMLGVYVHGNAGDAAHARMKGPIIASDIAAEAASKVGEKGCSEISFS